MSYSCRDYENILLCTYCLIFFNEKMPDTRSGKSKADEGEQNSELI